MGSFRILRQSLVGHSAEDGERESAMFRAAVPNDCMAQSRWRHFTGTDRWESQGRKNRENRHRKPVTDRTRQKRLTERIRSREARAYMMKGICTVLYRATAAC